uniref:Uncharacterized protein n=1 Tax=Oryza barthii TaxID=65489 RepID=A0A0D3ELB2_9ORYZ
MNLWARRLGWWTKSGVSGESVGSRVVEKESGHGICYCMNNRYDKTDEQGHLAPEVINGTASADLQDNGLDGDSVEQHSSGAGAGALLRLAHVQHHVHEVPVISVRLAVADRLAAAAPPLAVVRDDTLQQAVHRRRRARHLGVKARQLVHPRQPWHELPHRHRPEKPLEVGEQLPQLLSPLVAVEPVRAAVAERRPGDDAVGVGHEQVAQQRRRTRSRSAATSCSLTPRKEAMRRGLRRWSTLTRRAWRQNSPYGANTMSRP